MLDYKAFEARGELIRGQENRRYGPGYQDRAHKGEQVIDGAEVDSQQPGEAFHNKILTNKAWLLLKRRDQTTRFYEM